MATVAAPRPNPGNFRALARKSFYPASAGVMLLMMLWGFRAFYLRGHAAGDQMIMPVMLRLDVIHGSALTAWVTLFFVQTVLVASDRRSWHKVLGWCALAVAATVCTSGSIVAVESVRNTPGFVFFGMDYRLFLLVMLTEMAAFATFVVLAVIQRKRPQRHRAMMLMATLSIIAGSTARMPGLAPYFTDNGWSGLFGPVTLLGATFLLLRSLIDRKLDRWMAWGLLGMSGAFALAIQASYTGAWDRIASSVFGV